MKIKQSYELVRIDRKADVDVLKEHPQNPRRGNVEAIDESIGANGWYGAVTAQKSTGYILAGNHRFRAARLRGAREIPVIWVDVDDETALRILLADNKTADLGTYDEEVLSQLLDGLDTLEGTGYGLQHLQALDEADPGEADDALPEPEDIPDDRYEPQYGVILVLGSEDQQREVFDWLQAEGSLPVGVDADIRLVAV